MEAHCWLRSVLNNMCVLTKPRTVQTLCPGTEPRSPLLGLSPRPLGSNSWAGPRGLASSSPATAHVPPGPAPPRLPSLQACPLHRDTAAAEGVSVVPTPRWRMLKSQEPAPATSPQLQRELIPLGKGTARLLRVKVRREQNENFTTWVFSGSPPGKRQATPHPETISPPI